MPARRAITGLFILTCSTPLLAAPPAASGTKTCFAAADGYWIHADYYPPTSEYEPAPMVMLLHDWGTDRSGWSPLIFPLREAGFAVLVLDLRGHGESGDSETKARAREQDPSLATEMYLDLRGAYDWLASQPHVDRARFALVGAGTGADLALRYAVEDRSVDMVVCLSPRRDSSGFDPAGDLGQLRGRHLLLLAGSRGRADCQALAARADAARVRVLDTDAAGTALLTAPDVRREIVRALVRGVGEPSQHVVCGSINSHIFHTPDSGWVRRIHATNLRYYSSAEEARARGLRPSRTKGPRPRRGPSRGAPQP